MKVVVSVTPTPHGDVDDAGSLAIMLRRELLELDVDSVELVRSDDVPSGAKAANALAIGNIIVSLMSSSVVGQVARALCDWMSRDRGRHVRLEIDGDVLEVDRTTADQQTQLIATFLARHLAQ